MSTTTVQVIGLCIVAIAYMTVMNLWIVRIRAAESAKSTTTTEKSI